MVQALKLPLSGTRGADGITFYHRGRSTSLWSSTPSSSNAYRRFLSRNNSTIYRGTISQSDSFSVRCIKD